MAGTKLKIKKVKVGLGTCGIAAGASQVYQELESLGKKEGFEVGKVGCLGLCYREPLINIEGSFGRVVLGDISPSELKGAWEDIKNGYFPEEKIIFDGQNYRDNFITRQKRIVLRNVGLIDPEDIEEYLACNGYKGLERVLTWEPEKVLTEVEKSGLRGRGGAGFPTGLKWKLTRAAPGDTKYIICNADEGDPGAFMDRSILEGDPHSVVEGMIIAGYAVGASEGYIYVRAEYPLAVKRIEKALKQAEKKGFLGENILGSKFSFKIKIKEGAGAFVCGEETALIASIEGKRGMPRLRPPFPANRGLWGKPTSINNVETFANIPWIILHGAEEFASIGTEDSKGTKVFALAGRVKKTGLVEVPMGTSLKEIIFDIGGGIKEDKKFKAVQIGGPSGGCLPDKLLETPVEYRALTETGAIMGSGGMIVLDETSCMVDLARYFLTFIQSESCGKCVPCRVGTKRMLEMLNRLTEGELSSEEIPKLEALAHVVRTASLCGLGQTAPNPVLTTLKYFFSEYDMHAKEKRCPAGVCTGLTTFVINEKVCTGCGICVKHCVVKAISGEKKKPHRIDVEKCVKCGLCLINCPFDAIYKV